MFLFESFKSEFTKNCITLKIFSAEFYFHASQKPFEIKIVRKWAGFQSLNKYWRHRRPDQVFNWTAKSPLWSPVIIAFNCIYVSGFIRAVFCSDSTSPKGVPSKNDLLINTQKTNNQTYTLTFTHVNDDKWLGFLYFVLFFSLQKPGKFDSLKHQKPANWITLQQWLPLSFKNQKCFRFFFFFVHFDSENHPLLFHLKIHDF